MALFNEKVLAVLAKHGYVLTEEEINQYKEDCTKVERDGILGYKIKKNKEQGRKYSTFHTHVSNTDPSWQHFLILPAPEHWITKDRTKKDESKENKALIVNKLHIDLETAEEYVMKVRRPETFISTSPTRDSFKEKINNDHMNVQTQVFTRYHSDKGTKAYLKQPYRGKRNLYEVLNDIKVPSHTLLDILIQSGERLKNIHDQGYLHADFKPQNIVCSDESGELHVIDFETLMSEKVGKEGIDLIRGTVFYMDQDWYQKSLQSRSNKKPIYYTRENDVFAFLVMAKEFLNKAFDREADIIKKTNINNLCTKIEEWRQRPLGKKPELDTVLSYLKGEKPASSYYKKLTN